MHHNDAVRDAQALADLGRRVHDRKSARRSIGEQLEDFGLRADVDTATGFVEQNNAGIRHEHLADDDFLLIAARQRSDRRVFTGGLDVHVC